MEEDFIKEYNKNVKFNGEYFARDMLKTADNNDYDREQFCNDVLAETRKVLKKLGFMNEVEK